MKMTQWFRFPLPVCILLFPISLSSVQAACPAVVANPGFNAPFTGGVASGWTVTPETGITPKQFTGAPYEGSSAQGFQARTGWNWRVTVYQVITVCPGSEYEVRIRAGWINLTSNSNRWVSSLGAASGAVTQWGQMSVTETLWDYGNATTSVDKSLRIVALGNQITVMAYLELGWSDAWVDDMVITEVGQATVPPTSTPSPTPLVGSTATPTPTSPSQLGPNILVNGDFESGFQSGLANNWTSFATAQTGYTKENARLGRIGGGIYGFDSNNPGQDDENVRMSAKTYLVDLGRYNLVERFRNELGNDVLTIAKTDAETLFPNGNPYLAPADPEANGRTMADWWHNRSARDGFYPHAYYGLNEPDMNTPTNLQRAARFDLAFTRRLHELGHRSIVLNHSFGTPGDLNNMLLPEVRDLLAEADYLGYHGYAAGSSTSRSCDPNAAYIVFRYDQIAPMYAQRNWRIPPMIYTEGGDFTFNAGEAAAVRDDMICFEGKLRERSIVGLCYFVTGSWGGWHDWDITRFPLIIDGVRDVNRAHPVDAHDGTGAQQVGGERAAFDRGVVQSFATQADSYYLIDGWAHYTFYDGYAGGGQPARWPAAAEILVGWDPTGQTGNPAAPSIQWSSNLIGTAIGDADLWYRFQKTFTATGNTASLWLRGRQQQATPSVRVSFDDVSVRRDLAGVPVNNNTTMTTY